MKKTILTLVSAIVLLSQTACVIRQKLPDENSENSGSSEYDIPVINPDTGRTIGNYMIKDTDGGVEIIRCFDSSADIVIPEKLDDLAVVSIGNDSFSDLEKLQSLTIPSGVTKIGDDAFSGCHNLLGIDIPDSVAEIGSRAFADCTSLKSVRVPEKVRTLKTYTFYNCYVMEEVTLSDNITSIEKGAFFNCAKLTAVTLPEKLKFIDIDAFYNCFELKSIKLPDTLEHLGKKAFEGCFRLEEIFFKGDVYTVYIGDDDYDHTELLLAVNGELEDENSGADD